MFLVVQVAEMLEIHCFFNIIGGAGCINVRTPLIFQCFGAHVAQMFETLWNLNVSGGACSSNAGNPFGFQCFWWRK
jgi:hypothetical protein